MVKESVNLCLFWHMHQPDYRGSDGVMQMPWVFLHAIKDYYEMPWLLSRHKGLKATFNITAPLIEQLNLYSDPLKNDYFLSLWAAAPSSLDAEARSWLIKTCKSTQYETMIRPIEALDRLYQQEHLDDAELMDFEVLFMLTWCGHYLRQNSPLIEKLFAQKEGYNQEDKSELLKVLSDFVATILPFYAQLQREGTISLATTPYNHPILPLLLDVSNAQKANPHTPLPDHSLSLREDALEQVDRAIALYEETFGVTPQGFWPAEGAVDEESVEIYRSRGLKWIATDEVILFKSLGSDDRSRLYSPYRFNEITIGFRDHGLSDLVGFNYRFMSGDAASEHFMEAIKPMADSSGSATVFVILDGENAWEFFENNAYDFFTSLYQRFEESSWCRSVSMDEVSKMKAMPQLERLAPGSWIHGDFNTWSGHAEKNRAWELIYQTKRDVENYSGSISDELSEKIKFHFLAAECSDWFWWYGDDHVTEFAFEFDALFREHLMHIYQLLEMHAPSDLFEPIITHKSSLSFLRKPQSSIAPIIDGKQSSFFEWLGCGSVDESKLYSTMDRVRGPIEMIYYGHDREKVYIAFEGDMESLDAEAMELLITIEENGKHLRFGMDGASHEKGIEFALDERLELALSRELFDENAQIHLRFEIRRGTEIIQTMPGYGSLAVNMDETYSENWFV